MPTDRRWSDADHELVVSVLWTRARQGGNAGVRLDPQPAADAPMHYWADAAAVLDAVAPLIAARVREQVAEEIAQAIEATARTSYQTRGPAYRDAAAIARAHTTTPGDDHA